MSSLISNDVISLRLIIVRRTKKKKVFIVSTNKRPVPLEHYLYANEDIFKIVDKTSTFLHAGYTAASKSFKPAKPGKVVGKPQQQQNRNVPTSVRVLYFFLSFNFLRNFFSIKRIIVDCDFIHFLIFS